MTFSKQLAVLSLALVLAGAGCTVTTTGPDGTVTRSMGDDGEMMADGLWMEGEMDQGSIPSSPIAGTINGVSKSIEHVQIDMRDGEYAWTFSDTDFPSECSFVSGADSVKFRSNGLAEGTFEKGLEDDVDFDDAHAYYVYAQDNGSPFSVNTGWAAKLVVTDIERGVSETTFGDQVGRVAGYAMVEFEDGKTEIAGAFEAELCEKQ